MIQDLRYGIRMLLRNRAFTTVVLLTLALGIGANTAIFSLVDAAMLKVLPVEKPEQLVVFNRLNPVGGGESFSYPQFEQFLQRNQSFASVFGFAFRQLKVSVAGRTEESVIQLATDQYFSALGVRATLGQTLNPTNDRIQSSIDRQVAVISDSFWQRRFGRDPAVIGRNIIVNGAPIDIIGVTPPGFVGISLDYAVDIWLPFSMQPQIDGQSQLTSSSRNLVRVMARLRPGVTVPEASSDAELIFQQSLRSENASTEALAQKISLAPGGRPVSDMRSMLSRPLLMLMVITSLVLLIACANIANLLLAKAASRRREIAVRLSLGATRLRIIRQLLTESLVLALIGGVAGIFVGQWSNGILLRLAFNESNLGATPKPPGFDLDWRILGFTLAISLTAGVLFGLAPATIATRQDLISQLKEATTSVSAGRRRLKLNQLLVSVQLAASLVLLIVAGLFVRSFQNLANVELGFNPNSVQLRVATPPNYSDVQRTDTWSRISDTIASYPDKVAASASLPGLFSRYNFYTDTTVEGVPPRQGLSQGEHDVVCAVTSGFFATMEMTLLKGRDFGTQDHRKSVRVAIINERLGRRLFENRDPLGEHLRIGNEAIEVVGVVRDAKYDSMLANAPPMLYVPLEQSDDFPPAVSSPVRFFEVRTTTDAASSAPVLQRFVQNIDDSLSVESLPIGRLVDRSLALQRLIARLTGFFGSLGLVLACLGVYGVMSYTTVQRTSEMGIRLALGAQRVNIIRMVLWEAMRPVLIGIVIGLGISFGVVRLMVSGLFGLRAMDPTTILMATALIIIVAAAAAYLPARKASLVDPMIALRYE